MGKSPKDKRLVIWVYHPWMARPEIAALDEKGHTLVDMEDTSLMDTRVEPDLILHPSAHYWHDSMWETNLLEVAIKAARAKKMKEEK